MRSASPGFSKTVGNDSVDISINEFSSIRYAAGKNEQNRANPSYNDAAPTALGCLNRGQDRSGPTEKIRFTIITKPSVAIVGRRTPSIASKSGVMICNAGSTNSGEVTAKAANVHALAAAVGQR